MTRSRQRWPWWRWALTGLCALALTLSAYLSWHHLAGGKVIGCGGGSPCDQVLNSRWSSIGGVLPVSGLAAGAYLAMLLASLSIGPATAAPVRRLAWQAMLVLVGAAGGSAVWFLVLQKWIIGAFCPYCTTTHIAGLLLAALVLWRAPTQLDDDSAAGAQGAARRGPAIALAAAGVALAGVMVTCQVVITPPAVYRDGQSSTSPLAIDPRAVPLVGSPNARYVIHLLFDYRCRHCQQLHFLLDEVIRRYHGQLAFALCPAPLNSQCNPYVTRDTQAFRESCDLAKLGLAVWVARREAFHEFDRWMFSLESGDLWHPRSLQAARTKAIALVGQARLSAALADPWIERYLQASIQIYGDNGGDAVPKLVFGSRWVVPKPDDADELIAILHGGLAVPRP